MRKKIVIARWSEPRSELHVACAEVKRTSWLHMMISMRLRTRALSNVQVSTLRVWLSSSLVMVRWNVTTTSWRRVPRNPVFKCVLKSPTTSWNSVPRGSSRHACNFDKTRKQPWPFHVKKPHQQTSTAKYRKDICFTNPIWINLDTCRSWRKIPTPAAGDKGVFANV